MPTPGRDTARFQSLRAQLRRERGGCWLCGQPIDYDLPAADPSSFSVDHVIPRLQAPHLAEVYSNLKPAHLDCNRRRGDRAPAPGLGAGAMQRQW